MKVLQFDFGQLTIDDRFIIGELSPGKHVEVDVISKVAEAANNHFHGASWAYISNRKHSYSINPLFHQFASEIVENMAVFAVVAHGPTAKKVAEIEKLFKSPSFDFIVCDSLPEAVERIKIKLREGS